MYVYVQRYVDMKELYSFHIGYKVFPVVGVYMCKCVDGCMCIYVYVYVSE